MVVAMKISSNVSIIEYRINENNGLEFFLWFLLYNIA